MKVKLTGYVKYQHELHAPGAVLALDDGEAERLVRAGVADALPEPPPKPATKPESEAEQPKKKRARS